MKKILHIIPFAGVLGLTMLGCVGNKSSGLNEGLNSPNVANKGWCELIMEALPEYIDGAKNNLSSLINGDNNGELCPCHETVTCNGDIFCISYKCQDRIVFISDNSLNMANKGLCDRLLNLPSEDGLLLKELVGGVEYLDENDNLIGRCECVSIVNCDEMVYCSKEECPWGTFSSLDSIINSGL